MPVLALLIAALAQPAAAQQLRENNIAADLVAEGAPVAGETLTVALHFRPKDGWHGYWSNPGDAGLGMQLDWDLPEGWQAGEPQYPVPHKLTLAGLMNHVFKGDYAVLVPIVVPAGAVVDSRRPITLDAEWLACTDQICVPEGAQLTLRYPQADGGANPFDGWRAALPPMIDTQARFSVAGDRLRIAIPLPASMDLANLHVFVGQDRMAADRHMAYAAEQSFFRDGDLLVAEVPLIALNLPPNSTQAAFDPLQQVTGILAFGAPANGVRFEAVPGEVPTGGERISGSAPVTAPLWTLILAALAGGLLLNLMPCVFPILSLKAMTLVRAGEGEVQARRDALAYTAGVVLACMAIGALLLVLRAGGQQIGWAFQLQEPGVVVALLVLAAVITANFAGVFEVPSLSVSGNGGGGSSFATGLLAAFVATPCTGPFMAAALGAALLLPPEQAMLLFAVLGLGLALPFLALGYVPALRSRLPKPGPWMNTFRRVMAIPMGLTALALLWLLTRLGGREFALVALVVTVGVLIALAVTGLLQRRGKLAWPAFGLIAAPFALAGAFILPAVYAQAEPGGGASILSPVNYSEAALAEARASGQPVFLWFTADWCVTCKVNESVAIERESTKDSFEVAGVVAMRGDWTLRNEEITRFLTEQGVAGVPLYMWYPADGPGEQLPQVLTPQMLADLAAS
ncbi:thioredoxin family protein [Altererythrobacter sp. KTW20L]|uniref:protein-disulfide reductase DsbD family protein n=1 Tax=Altererythrobacter sp. KTW20L TaxID=2942210 RepID=UPI0020BD7AB6|nr:protein-disulfide reductase DsbD domain-containing protein [Altererythrobacter sp. KTW20L]MCL6249644.1 thioredoxin family protein [Altererythrobacter sp. KTW20L]